MGPVVVTGAGGLLGSEVVRVVGDDAVGLTHADLDVADPDAVRRTISGLGPRAVVHCAAMTDVDACEADPERAEAVNASGTGALSAAADGCGARMVCVSTDYVFDGRKGAPYDEDDATNPLQVYGRSKLAGERLALAANPRCAVVRSAWIYGIGGKNFLSRLPGFVEAGSRVRAVVDQTGSPTYAPDLAGAIVDLLGSDATGVFHVVNTGSCTFAEFCEHALRTWGVDAPVEPVRLAELQRPAPRPADTPMVGRRWAAAGFAPLRPWAEAADAFCEAAAPRRP